VCCQTSDVYVAWVDNRNLGNDDIYYRMSSMNGVMNWLNEVRLDTGTAPGMARDYRMDMACGQGSVHVTWESDQNNIGAYTEDIYVNTALNHGMNWQGPQRVDLGSPAGNRHSCNPRISVGGGDGFPDVFVCYMDERNSAAPGSGAGFDVYANRSQDGGVTWTAVDFRVDVGDQPGLNDSYYPQVSYGSAPAFLYEDERNGLTDIYANFYAFGLDDGDILYTESRDGGMTWLNPPLRVNDDVGTNDQSHPSCDIKENGTVDVAWYDKRGDPMDRNLEVFFAALLPGATAFTPNQPVTDMPIMTPPGQFWIGDYIWLEVEDPLAHIVWTDNRTDPMDDIYYQQIENPEAEEMGACCFPDDSCAYVTSGQCGQQGGVFMGAGTTCTPNPCGVSGFPDGDIQIVLSRLHPNYPNPFNPMTTIRYELAEDSPVQLGIYDLAGKKVRALASHFRQRAGLHEIQWDGLNDQGQSVATGVYICHLQAGKEVSNCRMALIR